ncbi:phosphoribosylformimino-5-aminoimidazole carboxamide ribotide isomerase [Caldalkalibacillus uzonensis]|uniref:1-(5-phosphoribosyl)-5-[(5-phosphoribosylamino)methylideneamino] imidazole-4-carboxamide isomerase n=1 Tax=Caldalkalibacillus uzonensis TaxID=353224 RepID=A0ABU0CWR6_9BACI|nr:1-(5-phosphoribosyl)-5-[(5-phosphoribosylamino)methylideneamino]imidazole-4-carboxamide isomerase [Caldalkalibacillus uzonensis]MDQ0340851.1 phosphoribosylformimino-5-aminoimidazole carboxamide ribotide isomerase [Caldalkalibacillus uzonensis]
MKPFTLYPAIDIRGGQCVRLLKGDYNQETVYGSPLEMAAKWMEQGAEWLHVVDLDGAKAGEPCNHNIILDIARSHDLPIQVGGGIRSMAQVEMYLNGGIQRVILGTSAIKNPQFVYEALAAFGQHIAIGMDARNGYVATEGWLESSTTKVEEVALRLVDRGAQTFIFTDISKDGTLSGPNVEATVRLAQTSGVEVIASGGISSLDDLHRLQAQAEQGVAGAIIGKALYQGIFTLKEALDTVNGA